LISKQLSQSRATKKTKRKVTSVSHVAVHFTTIHIYNILHTADDFFDDDEVSNDGTGVISQAGLAGSAVDGLEDEARNVVARAAYARPVLTASDDMILPLRVPRETDPSIWSVRVKVGALHCL
jgi:hypothetical protein